MAKKKGNSVRKSLELERLRQLKIQEEEEAERKAQEEIHWKIEMERKMEIQTKIAQSLVELDKLDDIKAALENQREIEEREEFEEYKWNQYMRCDGNINPLNIKEVNTFLSLWLEHGSNSIDDILTNCVQIIGMVREINYVKKFVDYDQEIDLEFLKEIETKLLRSIREKIDMGTLRILENAIGYDVDFDTGNLHLVNKIDEISHCLWGNLSKAIKTTSHQFYIFDFTFDIPRSIQSADVAIRLIWESFDPLTPSSDSYRIRRVSKKSNNIEIITNLLASEPSDTEFKEFEGTAQSETEMGNGSEALKVPENDEETENEAVEGVVPVEEIDMNSDQLEEETSEYGEFDMDADVVDMRCYRTIGGLFHLEILNLPSQPITINQELVIKLVTDDCSLKKLNYSSENSAEDAKETQNEVIFGSPIRIKFKLPEKFLMTEEPDVAFWHEGEENWRTDVVSDVVFDQGNRTMCFSMTSIGTFAMIQELHIHMPYQSWEMRPRAYHHVLITMITSIVEFEIEIKDDLIRLASMQEYHDLDHILGKWMSLEVFVKALYDGGLNIFPKEDSNYFLKMNKKTKKLTNKVYLDISVTAPMMGFAYSHFNDQTDKDTCILQMAKPSGDEPINEDNWVVVTNSNKYVQCLKISEFESHYNNEPLDTEAQFHATLYHMTCEQVEATYSPKDNWKLCKTLESFIKRVDVLNYSV